ncbi:MAG: nuclear transport factor 2 family protein [Bacteroidota bacterium]
MNTIQESINTLFVATDQNDWEIVEQYFAHTVTLDYSSMIGQPAVTTTPQEIIKSWQSILPGFDHTHHQVSNFMINEKNGKATAFCYGTANHFLENENGNLWTVVGSYDFNLEKSESGWKISKMTFNFKYQSGNTALPQLAINRVKLKSENQSANE